MNRFLLTAATCLAVVLTAQWQTGGAGAQSPDGSPSHRFEELADGVYFAIGTGSMTVMSNNLVIVNDDHVMLVDSSVTPAAARGLVEGVKTLTDKPIKYVFNTHYHFDHAHGNQIFGDDVEIVAHDFVRTMLSSDVLEQRTNRSFTQGIPTQIERMKARLGGTTDSAERQQMETQLRIQEAHWTALQETVPTPPNVTYSDTLTLVKGGREVQLHFPGRGHTGGDTMVFLPEERIVFTGDFFVGRPGGAQSALHGRRLRGRVAGLARSLEGDRIRRHGARAWAALSGTRADRSPPDVSAGPEPPGYVIARPGCPGGPGGRPGRSQRAHPSTTATGSRTPIHEPCSGCTSCCR